MKSWTWKDRSAFALLAAVVGLCVGVLFVEAAQAPNVEAALRSMTFEDGDALSATADRSGILLPSKTRGSYFVSTTRSFIGMIALSVILMCSGQTSVQHLVMLQ